jgi:hypothetical protein
VDFIFNNVEIGKLKLSDNLQGVNILQPLSWHFCLVGFFEFGPPSASFEPYILKFPVLLADLNFAYALILGS